MNSHLVYKRYSEAISDELKAMLDNKSDTLHSMMRYQMGFGDDNDIKNINGMDISSYHLTSTMCLLTCELLAGNYKAGISAAVALEFVHQFMATHNHVLSDRKLEKCEKSVKKKWGFGQAINVGDGFYALARTSLFGLADSISMADTILALNLLDEACIEMCEGQHLDLEASQNFNVTESTYLKIAELKSGSIMGCSMGLGGLTANVGGNISRILYLSGQRFGIAHQIVNDILAIKICQKDLKLAEFYLNDRHLFPCVNLLENEIYSKETKFKSLYSKQLFSPQDVTQIINWINDSDAIQMSYNRAQSMIDSGIKILKDSHVSNDAISRFAAAVVPLIMQQD